MLPCILSLTVTQLPSLYNDILNHPNTSDELRRETETKLLKHKQQYMYALPNASEKKQTISQEVEDLINGAIILQLPDELAWSLYLERKDVETIGTRCNHPPLILVFTLFRWL